MNLFIFEKKKIIMYLKIEDNSRSGGSNVLDILFTAINHDS